MGPADLRLESRDPRADELDHAAAAGADQVIVPLPAVDVLIEEAAAAQALLACQSALDEEVEVAVDRGARDLEPASVHRRQQLLSVDVPVLREDLVEEGETLRSDPLPPLAQELEEPLFLPDVCQRSPLNLVETQSQNSPLFWKAPVHFVNRAK